MEFCEYITDFVSPKQKKTLCLLVFIFSFKWIYEKEIFFCKKHRKYLLATESAETETEAEAEAAVAAVAAVSSDAEEEVNC